VDLKDRFVAFFLHCPFLSVLLECMLFYLADALKVPHLLSR